MRVGKLSRGQIFGVVDVKNEKAFGINRIDHLHRRAAGVEMKTIDHQADIAAIHFHNYFVGQLQRLHAAVLLTQKFKRERDAMPFSDRSQLSKHLHRFLDYFIAAQTARRKLSGTTTMYGQAIAAAIELNS